MDRLGVTTRHLESSVKMPREIPTVHFYTRDGCHLCNDARDTLQAVLEERAAAGRRVPAVREVDLDSDAQAERKFGEVIPVLALDGRELRLATSPRAIRSFLENALDRVLA